MNDQELKEWARKKQDEVLRAVQSNAQQRKDFSKEYREYFYAIITTAGVIAGALVVLLGTQIPQERFLIIFSLLLQMGVITICFQQFRLGLMKSSIIVKEIIKIDKVFGDLSYWATKFQRDEIKAKEFKDKYDLVYNQYEELRNNDSFKKIEEEQEKQIKNSENPLNKIDWVFYSFVASLFFIVLALILPYFC
jgi:hypothetical protein